MQPTLFNIPENQTEVYEGAIYLDHQMRSILIGQHRIPLRNKEYLLFSYLYRNPRRIIDRTKLLEEVWDQNIFCNTNTIDVHVSALRKKLRVFSSTEFIKTVHCIGYVFMP